jgi:DhnA family fructose-bisphosphate aldolase class Ia
MANIQIGTNLRNCKITLAGEFYQPWGVLFSFQNNTTDVINSSSFTDTSMPGGMTVYDVNGSGIFSSVSINGFTSYGTLDATTFNIPNDKDYIVSTLDDGFTTATYEPLTSNIQIPITKNGKTTLATKGTKNVEDIDINVDIAPTIQSLSITPSETSQTFNASNVDGYKPVNVSAIQTETPSVNLSLASGNQTVNASSGKYIKSLTIKKPSTLVASNIKSGVNIAGVNGSYAFKTQNKTFTPTQTGGSVSADSGYDGLGVVTVNPVPLGNKTDVPLNFYNQTAGTIADSQNIYSDENKFMTWASVSRPSTLVAANIKKDVNIAGIIGTLESGGASLNIAYGGTAPSDTSKLWIKGSEANNLLLISGNPEPVLEDKISTLPTTLPAAAYNMSAAAVGTKIYLFGGNGSSGFTTTIQVFDTTNNTIQTLSTTLAQKANGMGAAAVGTKIYLFGGNTGSSYLKTIQVFDTTNNTIQTLSTTLPVAAYNMSAAAVGTKIYLFGGYSSNGYLDKIRVFDTTNNTISTLTARLPVAASGMGAASVGTKVYLFGGKAGSSSYLTTIRVFDTTNNTLSTLSTALPQKATAMGTAAVGTKIYLLGGDTGSIYLTTIQVFDTISNTILTLSTTLPVTNNEMGTAAVGTKVYLFGGRGDGAVRNTINLFAPRSIYLNPNSILITEGQQENVFNLLSSPTQVEISVKNVYRGDSSNVAQLNDAYLYDGVSWVNVNSDKVYEGGYALTVVQNNVGGTLSVIRAGGITEDISTNKTVTNVVRIDSVIYGGYQDTGQLTPNISLPFTLTEPLTITIYSECFIEGTPITLANHTYKNVEDITYDDNLLVWDFDKGEFSQAKPLWIMKQKQAIKYNHLVFSDNSELNTVEQHRIFNIEKGMFTYPMTEDTPIGTHTLNDKGEIVELVSKEIVEKEVNYYNIITNYHINLFAGHILTSCRLSNIYPIKDFKYVKDNREIVPFEKFNVPKEYYDGLRLGEQPTDINRDNADYHGDNSVEDYVKRLIRDKK